MIVFGQDEKFLWKQRVHTFLHAMRCARCSFKTKHCASLNGGNSMPA